MNKQEINEKIRQLEAEMHLFLSQVKKGKYVDSSQVVEETIEDAVDRLILLSLQLKEGNLASKTNDSLVIEEESPLKAPGFCRQTRIRDHRRFIIDERLSEMCSAMAETLIWFKKERHSFDHYDLFLEIKEYRQYLSRKTTAIRTELVDFYFLLEEYFPTQKEREKLLEFFSQLLGSKR
jgi:phosphatidylglycerophosphatase A